MNKYEITRRIEDFAPLETQEPWDCSGWVADVPDYDEISKVMLCLTVTDDVVRQARENNCDMIISHHPLFFVPFSYSPIYKKLLTLPPHPYPLPPGEGTSISTRKAINIYCAHTNLDLAKGGTTDCLIDTLFPRPLREREELLSERSELSNSGEGFVRYINTDINISDFIAILKQISPHLRYVNNKNIQTLHKIAFCAGSGSEFIQEAYLNGADALVTGDLKFHTVLESPVVIFDIGHFESEIGVLKVFENLINNDVEVIYAQETSPFKY